MRIPSANTTAAVVSAIAMLPSGESGFDGWSGTDPGWGGGGTDPGWGAPSDPGWGGGGTDPG
ncbi:hypothetical protein [Sorangium sp. So ce1335]|uniref:hypothetical protein n=1 Tax=Sorangium sp. So ce1335 TaxID=3133335 RepID=UPI003F609836